MFFVRASYILPPNSLSTFKLKNTNGESVIVFLFVFVGVFLLFHYSIEDKDRFTVHAAELAAPIVKSPICWCARLCGAAAAYGDCWPPPRRAAGTRRTCCACTDCDATSSAAQGSDSRRTASSDRRVHCK